MKIGNRIVKSAIAVFLSLAVFLALHALNLLLGYDQSTFELSIDPDYWFVPTNFYTPFFAGIAAVYALSRNVAESRQQAKLRSLGSVVGGYYGYIVIAVTEWLFLDLIKLGNGTILYRFILYAIVSLGIIGLLAITVKFKITYVSFISCLTYLSVTVSIRNGGMDPFLFATNRVLSTVIGVLIALFVNTFPQRRTQNKNILFVTSLDSVKLVDGKLNSFMEYKLNSLLSEGCGYTFMTSKAISSFVGVFKNVKLVNPVVVMSGCALYDPVQQGYEGVVSIPSERRKPVEEIFAKHKISILSYVINQHAMFAYYESLNGKGVRAYHESRRHTSYSFVQASVPEDLSVAQYVAIEKNDLVAELVGELRALPCAKEYNIVSYPFALLDGYSLLKVNDRAVKAYEAFERLKQEKGYDFVVCFGSNYADIATMKTADYSVCLKNAPQAVKDVADFVLPSDDPERAMRMIARTFHTKDYKKFLQQLKSGEIKLPR